MSDEVQVDITKAIVRFNAMTEKTRQAVRKEAISLRLDLEALVKQKLSGEVLNVVTGKLRRSIFGDEPENSATRIIERVASDASVKYGAIHEYGGKTSAHEIVAKNAKALAFPFAAAKGGIGFFKRVNHPGSVMPERSFMRSSLTEMRQEILERLGDAGRKGAAS